MSFAVGIGEVVGFLGLEIEPRTRNKRAYKVRCPFCDDRGYHLNVDATKDVYHCFRCSSGGGVLDLYSQIVIGKPLQKGSSSDGKKVFKKLIVDLYGEDCDKEKMKRLAKERQRRIIAENPEIYPLADAVLNHTYSLLLDLPPFKLSSKHKKDLMERGLNEKEIEKNGYRTIPMDCSWAVNASLVTYFKKQGLFEEAKKHPRLDSVTKEELISHFVVGEALARKGCTLKGVPGFYQLKGKWFFNLSSGLLIPTRNEKGEITCLQVRKDRGKVRYLTVSAKGLPFAVTANISRVHHPLSNAPLNEDTAIYLTEGPLKADVARYLIEKPVYFIAIQGVNNTQDLEKVVKGLADSGIKQIINALDMDKITNPHVSIASKSLGELIGKYKIHVRHAYWDKDHAEKKKEALLKLLKENAVSSPKLSGNPFYDAALLSHVLYKKEVSHSIQVVDGWEEKVYWDKNTSGIDDYLNAKRKGEVKC